MTDKTPLIGASDRDVFGSAREQHAFYGDQVSQDATYTPGYSDKRRHNAAIDSGAPGKKVLVSHRLHWARASTPTGKPDARDITLKKVQGYDFVTKDNYTQFGLTALPPAAQVDPATGRILLGDTVLMGCTREVAKRNENVLRRATDERSSADATASDLHQEGTKMGRQTGQSGLTEATVEHTAEVRGKK